MRENIITCDGMLRAPVMFDARRENNNSLLPSLAWLHWIHNLSDSHLSEGAISTEKMIECVYDAQIMENAAALRRHRLTLKWEKLIDSICRWYFQSTSIVTAFMSVCCSCDSRAMPNEAAWMLMTCAMWNHLAKIYRFLFVSTCNIFGATVYMSEWID